MGSAVFLPPSERGDRGGCLPSPLEGEGGPKSLKVDAASSPRPQVQALSEKGRAPADAAGSRVYLNRKDQEGPPHPQPLSPGGRGEKHPPLGEGRGQPRPY